MKFRLMIFAFLLGAGTPALLLAQNQTAALSPLSDSVWIQERDEGLELALAEQKSIEILPEALGLPEEWQTYQALEGNFSLEGDPVALELRVYGRRSYLHKKKLLSPGSPQTLRLDLAELPLAGSQYSPVELRFYFSLKDSGTCKLAWKSLTLIAREDSVPLPVADRFGQRYHREWDSKVSKVAELTAAAEQEWKVLSGFKRTNDWDPYGGWKKGEKYKATGFFRLEKKGKNAEGLQGWTLVTPKGYPFWSLGVTGLRHKFPRVDVGKFKGCEALFEALPPTEGLFSQAYEGEDYVSFYTWNVLRKWGSLQKWREVSFLRLQSWGMNTLGNWAHEDVLAETPMPYTRALRTNTGNAPRLGDSRVPDVFDPRWTQHLDSLFAQTAKWKKDPLLLGYFVDNEMGWGHLRLLSKAGKDTELREVWGELLQRKYRSIAQLNAAWGSEFTSWGAVKLIDKEWEDNAAFTEDYLALEAAFAQLYFQLIHNQLKKYDPNHLYLGCRFTRMIKPEHVVAAAGRWCDVLSVNVYSDEPIREDMIEWHLKSRGLPMLIGEHHVPLKSERQLRPKYRSFDAEQRYDYLHNYLKVWSQMPFAIGSHWYQYKDQPLTGRGGAGGENQIVGLVDITDQAHEHLIRALKAVSPYLMQWHQSSWEE